MHCDLTAPPPEAKRDSRHGDELFYFPETPGAQYTGCQWMWIISGGAMFLEDMAQFDAGRLVFLKTIERFPGPAGITVTECRYRAGVLVRSGSTKGVAFCPEAAKIEIFLTQPRKP